MTTWRTLFGSGFRRNPTMNEFIRGCKQRRQSAVKKNALIHFSETAVSVPIPSFRDDKRLEKYL